MNEDSKNLNFEFVTIVAHCLLIQMVNLQLLLKYNASLFKCISLKLKK